MAIPALVAIAAAGGVLSAYGKLKASKLEADALVAEADAKREQAKELLLRAKENAAATALEGTVIQGEQQVAFAKSGVALGEGTPLSVLEETFTQVTNQIARDLDDANYKAMTLQNSASVDEATAKKVKKAGKIQAATSIFQTAGSFASMG